MGKYEIELNRYERRKELMSVADMLNQQARSVKRKRTLLASERAVWLADISRRQIAVLMAVDDIDERARAEALETEPEYSGDVL
jgi:hypothetical protein